MKVIYLRLPSSSGNWFLIDRFLPQTALPPVCIILPFYFPFPCISFHPSSFVLPLFISSLNYFPYSLFRWCSRPHLLRSGGCWCRRHCAQSSTSRSFLTVMSRLFISNTVCNLDFFVDLLRRTYFYVNSPLLLAGHMKRSLVFIRIHDENRTEYLDRDFHDKYNR